MTDLEIALAHLPVAHEHSRLRTHSWMKAVMEGSDCTRLWTKKTWPPRASSRWMASLMMVRLKPVTMVSMGRRSMGGVSMTERSRTPDSDMCSVRGMGVAVRVSASTLARSCLIRSLWATPKRCSSSTTRRPRLRKVTSFESTRWVPMTTSTAPVRRPSTTAFCSLALRKRESNSDARGKRGEAVAEGMEVLLREHGGGHENGHLAAIGHRLEGGAQGDLGLAVAHVARHQPVHGPLALHVGLDFLDGAELVGRLLEAEGRLELALPGRVR